MRVLCLNCNRASQRLSAEIQKNNADIVLLQEWISHKTDQSELAMELLPGLGMISATRYLVTSSKENHIILHKSDRILVTKHDNSIVINTYFPAGKTSERNEHMNKLMLIMGNLGSQPLMIAGDFNLAPRLEDGWYGDNYSTFTKKSERVLFQNILTKFDLYDVGSGIEWAPTFERQIKGKRSRFRCDLFLVRSEFKESLELTYHHNFRTHEGMSDHSALFLELDL